MTLHCPFCEATLGIGSDCVDCEGETGGILTSRDYLCASCGAAILSSTTDKLGDRKERWGLMAAPLPARVTRSFHSTLPTYACPRCADGNLLPAVPVGELPTTPVLPEFAPRTRREREIEYRCGRCSQECHRYEEGSLSVLAVVYWNWLTEGSAGSIPPSLRSMPMNAPAERLRADSEAKAGGGDAAPKAT